MKKGVCKSTSVRRAKVDDLPAMVNLNKTSSISECPLGCVCGSVGAPKSRGMLTEVLPAYFVAETGKKVSGSCGYKIWPDHTVELMLAQEESLLGNRPYLGLVKRTMSEVKRRGYTRFIAFASQPLIFEALGFQMMRRQDFPAKYWVDCACKCGLPEENQCNHVALELVV